MIMSLLFKLKQPNHLKPLFLTQQPLARTQQPSCHHKIPSPMSQLVTSTLTTLTSRYEQLLLNRVKLTAFFACAEREINRSQNRKKLTGPNLKRLLRQ